MLRSIDEVHRRGMYIIFDGVFNHVGINHWAFQDVVKNQQRSIYKDWFKVSAWNDPKTGKGFKYEGWWSVKELPELRQDENGIVAGPRDYIWAITKRWMDPNNDGDPSDGIDGWRLDVAACIHHNFWKTWREHVKNINPEAYLTGEVVDTVESLKPYLQGDEFDAVMNYNFTYACTEYFMDERNRIPASEFDQRLRELREAFPLEVAYVMQNLLDSHDTDRFASRIVNRDKMPMRKWREYYEWSRGKNPDYQTREPNAAERQVQKLLAIFQMTYLGAPMIYYGDEAGMWGANDPCCRQPMVWNDKTEEAKTPDEAVFDGDLFEHYRKLIHIRNAHPALQLGDYHTLLADNEGELFAFSRTHQNQKVIIVLNNGRKTQHTKLNVSSERKFVDLLDMSRAFTADNGQIKLEIKAKSGIILLPVELG
jgi:glycosidase